MIGFIADHPTPKISVGGGTAYTVNSRDYKGMMIVVLSGNDERELIDDVLSEGDGSTDGEQSSGELLRTGCL